MSKEQLTPIDHQANNQDHALGSISEIQSQAHKEANTAVTKAMSVYWSWMVAGLLPTKPETKVDQASSSLNE
jgi:hypothetical protein